MQLARVQLARPAPAAVARPGARVALRPVLARSTGPHITQKDIEDVEKRVEDAIKEAEKACQESDQAHCAAAWDNVEELSAAVAHKKVAFKDDAVASDPLEQFCDDNPDADECRVYDD